MGRGKGKVLVAVRCRPLHPDRERGHATCVFRAGEKGLRLVKSATQAEGLELDYVFDEKNSQSEVYDVAVLDFVGQTAQGIDTTVFAYGQTGSGKTYTMLGVDALGSIGPDSGILPRVLAELFRYKESQRDQHCYLLLTVVEVYNTKVRDLLDKKKQELSVVHVGDEAVPGATLRPLHDLRSAWKLVQEAMKRRAVCETSMNDASSRSHAVFVIHVAQQAKTAADPGPMDDDELVASFKPEQRKQVTKGENPLRLSRFCMADLAGSERPKRSNVTGDAFEEACKINTSLTWLKSLIRALGDAQESLPFRVSTLNGVLRPSFMSPRCRLLLMVNVSPADSSSAETSNSLEFAKDSMRLKTITVAHDHLLAERHAEQVQKAEELSAELRIASVKHDFVLQVPELICAQDAADDAARAELVAHVAEQYRVQREAAAKAEEQRVVDEYIAQSRREVREQLDGERQGLEGSIAEEQAVGEALAAEIQAEQEREQEAAKELAKRHAERAEVESMEEQIRDLRRQLRAASAAGELDTEAPAAPQGRARIEEHHRSTDEFAKTIVALRELQIDLLRGCAPRMDAQGLVPAVLFEPCPDDFEEDSDAD